MRSGTQLCQRSKPGGTELEFLHGKVSLADQNSFCVALLMCSVWKRFSDFRQEGTCFDAEEDPPLDREQNFDDEARDTPLSEVEAGREQVGICSQ
eukprot:6484363-Amphidinium_carterae.1